MTQPPTVSGALAEAFRKRFHHAHLTIFLNQPTRITDQYTQENTMLKQLDDAIRAQRPDQQVIRRRSSFMTRAVAAGFAAALALAGIGMPVPAEAGALTSAVRGAIAKRAVKPMPPQPMAFGKPAYGKPRDVVINSKHPEAKAHIEHAQKNGQPTVLHIDRAGAAKRRAEATGTVNPKRKPAPGYERDEYPPAFTREGGANANVRFISPHDNRGAGAVMQAQTRDLPDGSKIRIIVK